MQQAVDQKQLAGIVTILARHGKVVDYRTYGMRDMASGAPMTKDTIFRDYSMTKPVTGVAMMILYEQGKWLPSDPISKYIPEFAHLKVFKGADADGKMILVDPDHPPTMRELMTHTAGFTYGFFGNTPVDKMYRDENVFAVQEPAGDDRQACEDSAALSARQRWVYSVSMDIAGLHRREAFRPVAARFHARTHLRAAGDEGCRLLCARRTSAAASLRCTASTRRRTGRRPGRWRSMPRDFDQQPTMPSGGGGMVSTAEDYYRFAQMLANGGELERQAHSGARHGEADELKSSAAEPAHRRIRHRLQVMRPGFGYGYNCAVSSIRPRPTCPKAKARSSGMARPAHGSGSIRRTMSSLWA